MQKIAGFEDDTELSDNSDGQGSASPFHVRYGLAKTDEDLGGRSKNDDRAILPMLLVGGVVVILLMALFHTPTRQAACKVFETVTHFVGFRINDLQISGHSEVDEFEILQALGDFSEAPIFTFDHHSPRVRLLSHPWVEDVTIKKGYPDVLLVQLSERVPAAVWQRDGESLVVDRFGMVISHSIEPRFGDLPLIAGVGANKKIKDITSLLAVKPEITKMVKAAILVADRRWTLRLKSGTDVLLPADKPREMIHRLAALDATSNLLMRDLRVIDMRFDDRLILTPNKTTKEIDAVKAAYKQDASQ